MSPERRHRRIGPFAVRVWLVAALMTLASALILAANLALLGYAQPRNDPVGQLTPARLMESERDLPSKPETSPKTVSTTTVISRRTVTAPTAPTTVTGTKTVPPPSTVTRPQPPPREDKTHSEDESDD